MCSPPAHITGYQDLLGEERLRSPLHTHGGQHSQARMSGQWWLNECVCVSAVCVCVSAVFLHSCSVCLQCVSVCLQVSVCMSACVRQIDRL